MPFFTDNFWYFLILYCYCWELLIFTANFTVVTNNCRWFWYLLMFLQRVLIITEMRPYPRWYWGKVFKAFHCYVRLVLQTYFVHLIPQINIAQMIWKTTASPFYYTHTFKTIILQRIKKSTFNRAKQLLFLMLKVFYFLIPNLKKTFCRKMQLF